MKHLVDGPAVERCEDRVDFFVNIRPVATEDDGDTRSPHALEQLLRVFVRAGREDVDACDPYGASHCSDGSNRLR